jgi:hypothetical protein
LLHCWLDLDVVKLVISKAFDVEEFTKVILNVCREAERDAGRPLPMEDRIPQ